MEPGTLSGASGVLKSAIQIHSIITVIIKLLATGLLHPNHFSLNLNFSVIQQLEK